MDIEAVGAKFVSPVPPSRVELALARAAMYMFIGRVFCWCLLCNDLGRVGIKEGLGPPFIPLILLLRRSVM